MGLMQLFEFRTGMIGCSYRRCYLWATDHHAAKVMFRKRYPAAYDGGFEILLLFSADAEPFVTKLDDEGFVMEKEENTT